MAPWRLEPPEADIQCDAGALPMVRPEYFTTEQHFASFRNLKTYRVFYQKYVKLHKEPPQVRENSTSFYLSHTDKYPLDLELIGSSASYLGINGQKEFHGKNPSISY